jgi:hypothetical protein
VTLEIASEVEVKKGRRLYGHFCTLTDGQVIYLARRKHREIFRSGKASISGAMTEGDAAWALDEITLYNLRARNIQVVGVRVIDTHDLYLTRLANFFDLKRAKIRDYTGIGAKGGARQRYLPLQFFLLKKGTVALDDRKIAP